MSRYISRNDIGSHVYPAPGGVTYGSRWLLNGSNSRPRSNIERYSMPSFGEPKTQQYMQSSLSSSSQRGRFPDDQYRPSDPYNDPYMDTYRSTEHLHNRSPPVPPPTTTLESKSPKSSLNDVVAEFSTDYSSAHGLPNIYKATTLLGKLFWSMLFLGFLALCGWQFYLLITKFLEFHLATEVSIVSDANLTFPAVTVCNINKVRRSAILKSKHREVLFIDDQQPLPYYASCLPGDFACKNRQLCIKPFLVCDGINHCKDHSDENNCNYGDCGAEQFKCPMGGPDGYCIDSVYECDRQPDCYLGYDEFDCDCKDSEWKCLREGGCIQRTKRCDGEKQCLDESDEQGCPKPDCSDGFQCTYQNAYSPNCITMDQVCDLYLDCSDESDESMYACDLKKQYTAPVLDPTYCPQGSDFINCGDGQCIQFYYICDGQSDCMNGYDESSDFCGESVARCTEEQFTCNNGRQCINKYQLCDIRPDCDDFSDESMCSCFITEASDATNILQNISCPTGNQFYSVPRGQTASIGPVVDVTSKYVHCLFPAYGSGLKQASAPTTLYDCLDSLYCFDSITGLLETCLYVYSKCYVAPNGQDYKGKVYVTEDGNACSKWNTNFIQSLGLPQYEHAYCRNPGGMRDKPWCFIEGATTPDDWKYCDVGTPSSSCLAANAISLNLAGGTSSAEHAEGRVEISLPDGGSATINDIDWTIQDGNAVCRHLGFNSATAVYENSSQFGPGTGFVAYSTVKCSGNERNLPDCILIASQNGEGNHNKDVGVKCTGILEDERRGGGGGAGLDGPLRKRRSICDTRFDSSLFKRDASLKGHVATENMNQDGIKRTRRYAALSDKQDHPAHASMRSKRRAPNMLGIPIFDATSQNFSEPFICSFIRTPIPWYQVCNNYPDCADGSDEFDCGPSDRLCPQSYRPCRLEETCIQSKFECDGRPDCRRGLDERFCQDIDCPKKYWKCTSNKLCIPEYSVCDTIEDCKGGEDEHNCTKDVHEIDKTIATTDWIKAFEGYFDDDAERDSLIRSFRSFYLPKGFDRVKGETPPDWKRFFTFSQQADYSDLSNVLQINRQEIKVYGHQRRDMILECYFNEVTCESYNFVETQTDEYGNCYTFNYQAPGGNKEAVVSNRSGPKHGLSLVLNLEQSEYLSLHGQRAGARVTINRPNTRPLPEEDGFMIRPGVETSVGLRMNEIWRAEGERYAKGPSGACRPDNVESVDIVNGSTVNVQNNGGYNRRVCLQTCLNTAILNMCKCSSTIELDGQRCKVTNPVQDICVEFITFLHQRDKLDCKCQYPCTDRFTTKTISQSAWPSDVYVKHLLRSVHAESDKTKNFNDIETASKNLAKLNVFYEELNYQVTKEIPAYESESLFSDIGGTLGLYIGFSVMTAIEFGVLIFEMCRHCSRKPKRSP